MFALGATPASESSAPSDARASDTLEHAIAAGVQALRNDQFAQAESLLTTVVDTQPGYVSPRHGAAAYWLGTAYERQERTGAARTVWMDGQEAVAARGAFDLRLADAYLKAAPEPDAGYDRAATVDVYRHLLRYADSSLARPEAAIVKTHAAQATLLMTEGHRRRISSDAPHDTAWALQRNAGTHLLEWWRQQDPAPATPANERMEEHIQRVATARAKYPHATRMSGLDDRGETYVRYGPPFLQRSISYNDAGFVLDVFRFGVNVSSFEFPENEIWTYPQIHHAAYFIFVEDDDHYYIGSSSDLMPSRLSNTFSNSDRHLNRAVSALAAMRYIFRDLALYHSDFGTLYNDIEDYASWQEMKASEYQMTGRVPPGTRMRSVGAGINQQRFVFSSPVFGIGMPSQFVQSTSMEQQTLDYHAQRIRKKELPPQATDIFSGLDSLSLTMRTARFLEPDGATRTEVYWGTL
ncbi:MAG: GWxTD domain-containing protein, partial [Bacteroidetes bacterium]|nr:GWxTD domain-containing protein [Bacteroidota bacterium]